MDTLRDKNYLELWRLTGTVECGHEHFILGGKYFSAAIPVSKDSWLSLWLQQLGARLTGYAATAADGIPVLFDVARVAQGMTSLIGDIRDGATVANAMRQAA